MSLYFLMIMCSAGWLLLTTQKAIRIPGNSNGKILLVAFEIISIAILMIIYVLRGPAVGTDYPMYHSFFYFPLDRLRGFGIENGYLIIYGVAKSLDKFWIVSLISFVIYFFGFLAFSRKIQMSLATFESMLILSYLYFTSFNMVRQMSAIGIIFLGIAVSRLFDLEQPFVLKRKIVFILFVLIAAQFHSSAYVAVIFLFCRNIHLTPRAAISGFGMMSIGYFMNLGNSIVPRLMYLFPHYVQKYSLIDNDFFTTGSKGLIEYLPILIQCVFMIMIISGDQVFFEKQKFICNMYFLYLMFFAFGGNQAAIRIQDYWSPAMMFFYGAYFESRKDSICHISSKMYKTVVVVFLALYIILRLLRNVSNVVPYYI
ncbi:EpsG family protein [Lacticaseibacillus suilingensis]|uniref:EpsG family protein n=1 Tax=Lacticaseibacillus suilingensis TaxID=2799577 RepID=UPI0022E417D3|nr:EpsG family protein [Lacticaseibacillus suilingensis]